MTVLFVSRPDIPRASFDPPPLPAAADIRETLFAPLAGRTLTLEITARQPRVLAGSARLLEKSTELRVGTVWIAPEGCRLDAGGCVFHGRAYAIRVSQAEEQFLGIIGKASGIATAAAAMVARAGGLARIVCGAWKKMPPAVRLELRRAIAAGGAGIRIVGSPFVYPCARLELLRIG